MCVLGMGGLGSWTALALATCGVGAIVGVDFDAVELSNLNRQVLYAECDIGASKAQAAGRLLRAYDSRLEYVPVVARMESADDVRRVIEGADAVVAAADWPPHRIDRWVSQACFALGTPYIAMSQQPPLVRVGPLYMPGETGCYACQETGFRQSFPDYDAIVETTSPFATTAAFGPACAVIGGMAASEIAHVVAGLAAPMTRGRAVFRSLDGRDAHRGGRSVRELPALPGFVAPGMYHRAPSAGHPFRGQVLARRAPRVPRRRRASHRGCGGRGARRHAHRPEHGTAREGHRGHAGAGRRCSGGACSGWDGYGGAEQARHPGDARADGRHRRLAVPEGTDRRVREELQGRGALARQSARVDRRVGRHRPPGPVAVGAARHRCPHLRPTCDQERRRRRNDVDPAPPATGRLETTATILGIAVALPAIAGLFFPGVGIKHHPPAQATMAVREVQARVTRGEFVRRHPRAERPRLRREDRREVGHVVWVELALAGFRGDDLTLTWASYSRAGGYSLIPRPANAIRVDVGEDSDAETRFVPIWVGLPKQKFQVRFRLIDDRRTLRQVARTDDMRGSRLRYACDQDQRS